MSTFTVHIEFVGSIVQSRGGACVFRNVFLPPPRGHGRLQEIGLGLVVLRGREAGGDAGEARPRPGALPPAAGALGRQVAVVDALLNIFFKKIFFLFGKLQMSSSHLLWQPPGGGAERRGHGGGEAGVLLRLHAVLLVEDHLGTNSFKL